MTKNCPHCGAALHREAAFCPHCARSIHTRTAQVPPRLRPVKAIRAGAALALAAAAALGIWLYVRSGIYDAGKTAEILYTDSDGTYQILINGSSDRVTPSYWEDRPSQEDTDYRIATRLYVNHIESGVNANSIFLSKLESAGVEVLQPDDSPCPMTASQPSSNRMYPEAAMVSLLDYRAETGPADLVWTIRMKNGDTLILRQHINIYPVETYNYYVEETDTIEDLQALIAEIEEASDEEAVVNIYLPAVTYAGGLELNNRAVNLYGSEAGGARTAFTGPTRVASDQGPVYYFQDIDFTGGGGVGISASAPLQLTGCTVSGWHTGLLASGQWASTQDTTFENNGTGFHFNSGAGTPTTFHYTGTRFVNNRTGVLLERVPGDQSLVFDGCLFFKNGTDIDNRCNQAVDLTAAIFE